MQTFQQCINWKYLIIFFSIYHAVIKSRKDGEKNQAKELLLSLFQENYICPACLGQVISNRGSDHASSTDHYPGTGG